MVNETTIEKLKEMQLGSIAEAFRRQESEPAFTGLSFAERFGLLVDSEWTKRRSNKLTRLIRGAGFYFPGACVEDIEYRPERMLDKALITKLSTCGYIREAHNIIILGPTGAGKTYMACALGVAACRCFHRVKYVRLPELINDLLVAHGTEAYKKLMNQIKRVELLIIDEWLLLPLKTQEAHFVHEIIDARHQKRSTVFLSQFAPPGWHTKIKEDTLAEAILDRIVHDSYEIFIDGKESMRKHKGLKSQEA